MKFKSNRSVEVGVMMNEQEARWLLAFIQNYPGNPDDESPESYTMRSALFLGVREALGDKPLERSQNEDSSY